MFKSIKIWCLMLVLAFTLPALVKAKAPPPKTKNSEIVYKSDFSGSQVLAGIHQDAVNRQATLMLQASAPAAIDKQDTNDPAAVQVTTKMQSTTPALNEAIRLPDKVGWCSFGS